MRKKVKQLVNIKKSLKRILKLIYFLVDFFLLQEYIYLKGDLSVVYSVASYSTESYEETERIFHLFQEKDVPQQVNNFILQSVNKKLSAKMTK